MLNISLYLIHLIARLLVLLAMHLILRSLLGFLASTKFNNAGICGQVGWYEPLVVLLALVSSFFDEVFHQFVVVLGARIVEKCISTKIVWNILIYTFVLL